MRKRIEFGSDGMRVAVEIDASETTDLVTILADRVAMTFEIGEARDLCMALSRLIGWRDEMRPCSALPALLPGGDPACGDQSSTA